MRPTLALPAALMACLVVVGCGGPDGAGSEGDAGAGADAGRGADATADNSTATATSAGGCAPEVENAAAQPSHVDPGTAMEYEGLPPVSGAHWSQWPDISKAVYAAEERPDPGELVHSQEHGWTVVWYDDTVAAAAAAIRAVRHAADEVEADGAVKVVFVAWTTDDGQAFPAGLHIAITHWGASDDGREYRQLCASADAGAVLAFVGRHPYTDAREPNGP